MRVQHHSCGTHPLDTGLQEGGMGDAHIWKGAMLMLHLHHPDARELTPCPLVSLQGVTRFKHILWRRSGTMGDQSCQLPRMPLQVVHSRPKGQEQHLLSIYRLIYFV